MKKIGRPFHIVCIGGMNIDRKYFLKDIIQYETSNPVTSSVSVGGVARNIAENLGRLGERVTLLSVSGLDGDWEMLKKASKDYMDVSHIKPLKNYQTGNYTAVLDSAGNLVLALADMDCFDHISVHFLKEKTNVLLQADCLVIDLNCPLETVEYVFSFGREHAIPVVVIPVSSPKMNRLPKSLKGLSMIIVNKDETETFFQMKINNHSDWKEAVERWLQLGVEQVIVTMGKQGVMAGGKSLKVKHFPSVPTKEIVDVTGAGDSFCSAVIHMFLHGYSFEEAIWAGSINAHSTIQSTKTVRTDLSRKNLLKEIQAFNEEERE